MNWILVGLPELGQLKVVGLFRVYKFSRFSPVAEEKRLYAGFTLSNASHVFALICSAQIQLVK